MLSLTGTAAAQNADAEFLFNEGVRFEAEGKTPEACDAFEASNRIEPRAGTLIRLGQCREKQGRSVSAWSAYKDSLTRVKDPAKKKLAEDRIAALAPTLSYLTVSVPDDSRVDGLVVTRNGITLEPVLWNRAVPVDAGAYTIAGSAPGHEAWQTTIEVGPTGDKASVEVPRFKAIKALVGPAPTPAAAKEPVYDLAPRAADAPSGFTGKRKLALGLAGVGLAAVAGGVVLGAQAKGFESDAFALCPDPAESCTDAARAQELADRGADRALYANIAYGVGAAAVVGAAVLWFTGAPSRADRIAVTPKLGAGFAGVTVGLGF
ncbi:MAG TPA: hypothetical protein VN253_08405 [Kofleriaceae bacterium]|nr:hypothetical protein [Kofleriaceae bacterium]